VDRDLRRIALLHFIGEGRWSEDKVGPRCAR
jgi:hypothetical protein